LVVRFLAVSLHQQNKQTMKELAFNIATKIATDKSHDTVYICCSVLKTAFLEQGYSEKQSNEMSIDSIKIIMKAMLRLTNK
jgi:hypothetical protein